VSEGVEVVEVVEVVEGFAVAKVVDDCVEAHAVVSSPAAARAARPLMVATSRSRW
jgi:hypothetical protein